MLQEISLSEARRQLSSLVRRIEEDPEVGYRILVRDRVVAELRSPQPGAGQVTGMAALLKLSEEIARRGIKRSKGPAVTSQNYKEFLYGHWPPAGPRRRR